MNSLPRALFLESAKITPTLIDARYFIVDPSGFLGKPVVRIVSS